MKFLFIFAHPDDESIGPGGTIRLLANAGHEVSVVSVTAGSAGENADKMDRKKEFFDACKILGVKNSEILNFVDGKINNEAVWGKLTIEIRELIDKYKPDVMCTFDHSGWYFHLDHVGVSIATTIAAQQAEHRPEALLLVHHKVRSASSRWKYVFPKDLPADYKVDISSVVNQKVAALQAHKSQEGTPLWDHIKKPNKSEFFQTAVINEKGKKLIRELGIFKKF